MKKILILSLMLASKATFAQLLSNICPCGMQIVIGVEKFNFRKPRTECSSGFGLCFKIDKIYVTCSPCEGGKRLKASLDDGMVTGYLRAECGNLTLHLPASLSKDEIFSGEPLNEFEIEEDAIALGDGTSPVLYRIAGGVYPVEEYDGELLIRLNYK